MSVTRCKKCGTSIAPGEKKCAWCGAKIRKSHKRLTCILFLIIVICVAAYIALPKKLMIGFENGNLRIKTNLDIPSNIAKLAEKNNYDVEFTECDIVDGKAVITYNLTNNTNESNSELFNVIIKAFQDGLEIDEAYNTELTGDTFFKSIQSGATVELKKAFELSNLEAPIVLEAKELTGDVIAKREFEIKKDQ